MHKLAEEWDKKYRTSQSAERHKKVIVAGVADMIPLMRPCDHCGIRVKEGFIHTECLKARHPVIKKMLEDDTIW